MRRTTWHDCRISARYMDDSNIAGDSSSILMALGEPGAEKWKVTMGDVMDSLYQTDIWELVELPVGR